MWCDVQAGIDWLSIVYCSLIAHRLIFVMMAGLGAALQAQALVACFAAGASVFSIAVCPSALLMPFYQG